ncbi:MAG TPA: hypothetical protein VNA12_05590 [Mycobacteriales bacterium]|nr:hypothetical protein [Mycobacteriales bacterium]
MSQTTRAPRLLRLALVGVLVGGFAAPADAARNCELLRDEKGDSGVLGGEGLGGPLPGTYEPMLDILSADLAADAKQLTVVIRVAELGPTPAVPLVDGGSWSFHFATPESAFFLAADRTHAGESFMLHHYLSEYSGDTSQSFIYEPVGEVTGVIDVASSEIRMTVPLAMFKPHDAVTMGTTLHKLLVISWYKHEPMEQWSSGGEADETGGGGKATYRVGTRNCVKVGR